MKVGPFGLMMMMMMMGRRRMMILMLVMVIIVIIIVVVILVVVVVVAAVMMIIGTVRWIISPPGASFLTNGKASGRVSMATEVFPFGHKCRRTVSRFPRRIQVVFRKNSERLPPVEQFHLVPFLHGAVAASVVTTVAVRVAALVAVLVAVRVAVAAASRRANLRGRRFAQ